MEEVEGRVAVPEQPIEEAKEAPKPAEPSLSPLELELNKLMGSFKLE